MIGSLASGYHAGLCSPPRNAINGRSTTFPTRIPLPIFAGDIDHMSTRPDQIGSDLFETMDDEIWQRTGRRQPSARTVTSARPR
jgi:hypothetical protein